MAPSAVTTAAAAAAVTKPAAVHVADSPSIAGDDILVASFEHGTSMLPHGILEKPLKTHLFGAPIAHSMAPLLHNTLFDDHAVPWSYSLYESHSIAEFKALLMAPDCIGTPTPPHASRGSLLTAVGPQAAP